MRSHSLGGIPAGNDPSSFERSFNTPSSSEPNRARFIMFPLGMNSGSVMCAKSGIPSLPRLNWSGNLPPSAARSAKKAEREFNEKVRVEEELRRARQKFAEMDADGNGTLSRDEMGELSRWVMASFSKDTAALSAAQQEAEVDKLIATVERRRRVRPRSSFHRLS